MSRNASASLWFRGIGLCLVITAVLKSASAFGAAKALDVPDPLFSFLTTRYLLLIVSAFELAVAAILWRRRFSRIQPVLCLWLAALFTAYRSGLWVIGFTGTCPCLGRIGEWIPISDGAVQSALLALIGIMYGAGLRFIRPVRENAQQTTGC